MNNEIRIIKVEIEQPKESRPQSSHPESIRPQPNKPKITQDSPIIRALREAEEKHRIRRELSDDELIELEFKEEADKIRAQNLANKKSLESSVESTLSNATIPSESNIIESSDTTQSTHPQESVESKPKPIVKELPIDDKNLAYIRDLDEPTSSDLGKRDLNRHDFDKHEVGIKIKSSTSSSLGNKTLHREPLRRLNSFASSDTSSNASSTNIGVRADASKEASNIAKNTSDLDSNMSLMERLAMDRQRIQESKKAEIRVIQSHKIPPNATPIEQDEPINGINITIDSNPTDEDSQQKTTYMAKSYDAQINDVVDSVVESSEGTSEGINEGIYTLPPTSLLNEPRFQKVDIDGSEIDIKAHNLISKLRVFRINGDITDIYSGPVVTTFEFRPAPDVKVSRIQNLENDLSMALKAKSIRIQAPIPGKDVVGIEIPNNTIHTIYIREIFESKEFIHTNAELAIALGKDIIGRPIIYDLAKLPHLLIAGTTGSGKSVGLNGMILSLLYKNTPEQLRFIMIDPKRVELNLYKDIPHLLTPIIADPKKAVIALSKATDEMNRRYELMNEVGVKNIIGYNDLAKEKGFDRLPYIVIIIDEFADLMIMGGKDSEQYLTSLASKARASGIHLIIATQRPTVNVVTGLIKSNLPSRISYRVGSPMDSKVVLDKVGAETLLGNGDMLFSDKNMVSRYHAPYSSEKEIELVANFIRSQKSVEYDEFFSLEPKDITQGATNATLTSEDEYMQKAKEIILSSGRTSASYLQRMLGVGFNRASNILESLEKEGFLSAPNAKNIREIIGYNKAI